MDRPTEGPSPGEGSPTPAASRTATLELVPAGVRVDAGTLSFQVPGGYELVSAEPEESTWAGSRVTYVDHEYRGYKVLDTMVAPDAEVLSALGEQADGLGFGGGVVYLRGLADITVGHPGVLRNGPAYARQTVFVAATGRIDQHADSGCLPLR